MATDPADLLRAERAVLKAKADLHRSEQQQAAYEQQGLTRVAQLAQKHRRKAQDRHAHAITDLERLRGAAT